LADSGPEGTVTDRGLGCDSETEQALVASAWSRAIREGFLEGAGIDQASGEKIWRLSDRGRSRAHAGYRR
jgi:hypothetical protein